MLPKHFTAAQLSHTGFSLTYRAKMRSERQDRLAALYDNNSTYLDAVAAACLSSNDAGEFSNPHQTQPRFAQAVWRIRQAQGKVLSILRLIKAAGTFTDPLDYLL